MNAPSAQTGCDRVAGSEYLPEHRIAERVAADPGVERRYCYLGAAFRFPDELLSPQEFTQAGIEWFGAAHHAPDRLHDIDLALTRMQKHDRVERGNVHAL